MVSFLQFLFTPHQSNNFKPKTIQLSSLALLLFLIVFFQAGLSLLLKIKPGVLGYATNIIPEQIIKLTNSKRQEQGLGSLSLNPLLVEAARQKASLMFSTSCWAHNCAGKTPWWFFKNVHYNYLYAGENLAKDFADSSGVVNAWMASPSHRENILNSHYKEIGVAVVNGVLNGEETTLVVQMFGTPVKTPVIAYAESQKGQAEAPVLAEKKSAVKTAKTKEKIKEEIVVKPKKQINLPAPPISSFDLTKIFYILVLSLLIIILTIDTIIISKKKIVRISGKSFIHASFFIIILLSVLLSISGKIL